MAVIIEKVAPVDHKACCCARHGCKLNVEKCPIVIREFKQDEFARNVLKKVYIIGTLYNEISFLFENFLGMICLNQKVLVKYFDIPDKYVELDSPTVYSIAEKVDFLDYCLLNQVRIFEMIPFKLGNS